ncbi:MAG: LLM class flavin-dependent oxidoreductase [Alphaproteobacteria bacterium]|nr:LLM class flavin-dependent oxidoreductase [Alphaproteobacteria bacterium]
MRIGLFTAMQWSPEENPAAVLKALREQVRAARDNGFSSLIMGQHLLTGPMGMFQTVPLLGHLTDDAAGMQIGPGVLLLSMMNPVLAAEEAATIDWLSDGNYVLCAGLGYRTEEFQAMGVEMRQRVGRLTEGLEVIKRLWGEDSVTHHGKHFQLDDAKASVKPKQRPRPPIWLGGDVEAAVRRAARIADAWCVAPTLSTGSMLSYLEVFRDERRKTDQAEDIACPLIRECFVGRDAAHAREVSRGPLLFKYRAYASWGQGETTEGGFDAAFDDFAKGRFLIGDSEQVKHEILHYAEIARTDQILLRVQWPGLDHQEALGNIDRIGKIIADLS